MSDAPDINDHDVGTQGDALQVELPGGGHLHVITSAEVELWDTSRDRYIDTYGLTEHNDLLLLGALLSQQLAMYRAQQKQAGLEPEFDAAGLPTGRYVKTSAKAADIAGALSTITKCSTEIREIEKTLSIDKKSREAGGTQTVPQYVMALKQAARDYGLHLSNRVKAYEAVMMDARWKIRLLRNGDVEDRQYHGVSTAGEIVDWLEQALAKLEEVDREYAAEKGKLYLGQLR